MHTFTIKKVAVSILCLFCLISVQAQTSLEWQLNGKGFFDNSEGDDSYRTTMTYSGLRVSPEVGVGLDNGKHALMAGWSGLAEWGHKGGYTDGDPIIYYRYQNRGFRFLFGSFDRDRLIGDYPSYMISDTIRYYRPMIQGFAFQYQNDGGDHVEAFLDWTSARSDTKREQFMLGFSARKAIGQLAVGAEGYYYHYALTWKSDESEHIHDYFVGHPYIGYTPVNIGGLSKLDLRLGTLISLDRERGGDSWHTPVGFTAEVKAAYRNLFAEQLFYAGAKQQHYGSSHFGQFYWSDTYYQAHFYSRTDVKYRFIAHNNVEAFVGGIFNITGKGLNWHQTLTLKFSLGSGKKL